MYFDESRWRQRVASLVSRRRSCCGRCCCRFFTASVRVRQLMEQGLRLDLGAYRESKNIFVLGRPLYTHADGAPSSIYAWQYSSARTSLDFGARNLSIPSCGLRKRPTAIARSSGSFTRRPLRSGARSHWCCVCHGEPVQQYADLRWSHACPPSPTPTSASTRKAIRMPPTRRVACMVRVMAPWIWKKSPHTMKCSMKTHCAIRRCAYRVDVGRPYRLFVRLKAGISPQPTLLPAIN